MGFFDRCEWSTSRVDEVVIFFDLNKILSSLPERRKERELQEDRL